MCKLLKCNPSLFLLVVLGRAFKSSVFVWLLSIKDPILKAGSDPFAK